MVRTTTTGGSATGVTLVGLQEGIALLGVCTLDTASTVSVLGYKDQEAMKLARREVVGQSWRMANGDEHTVTHEVAQTEVIVVFKMGTPEATTACVTFQLSSAEQYMGRPLLGMDVIAQVMGTVATTEAGRLTGPGEFQFSTMLHTGKRDPGRASIPLLTMEEDWTAFLNAEG